jgi:hypothetical protein
MPGVVMPFVPTPTQDSESSEDDRPDATRYDAGKLTPNVPMLEVPTPKQNLQ